MGVFAGDDGTIHVVDHASGELLRLVEATLRAARDRGAELAAEARG